MNRRPSDEDVRQLEQLRSGFGIPGSGRVRYAAAMHFHGLGLMSEEELEVFRICSPLDHENPARLMRDRGLGPSAERWLGTGQRPPNRESAS